MDERQFPGEEDFSEYTNLPQEPIPLTFSPPEEAPEQEVPESEAAAEEETPYFQPPEGDAPAPEESDEPAWQSFIPQPQEEGTEDTPELPEEPEASRDEQEALIGTDLPDDASSALAEAETELTSGEADEITGLAPQESAPSEPVPEENEEQEYRDNGLDASQAGEPPRMRPVKKGRPKRRKSEWLFGIPGMISAVVWLALIVAIGVTLGRMLWVCAADMLAFGKPDRVVTLTVYESESMEDIVNKLYDNGLIRYKGLFSLYADISHAEDKIKPGIYDLNTQYDYHALVNSMTPRSSRSVVEVTIPEGYSCRQIFALLEENRVCTAQDIAAYAASGELADFWFLENVERGSEYCLEGFLFPDTYQFYKNSTPREALEKMLNNFGNRFTEEMRAQIDTLNADVTGGGYGVREIVIVASLIEKESAAPSESPMIASVIYNRLHHWEYPALLNIDATIIYAQGGDARTIDTSIDSPYNTYRYTGLTPTPIANPGLSSLQAALNPESSNYYFYVLNPATGMHQFSTTQEEHDAWIAKLYNNG